MSVDYDLVVVGSSAAGIYAATMAAQLQARVALVNQGGLIDKTPDSITPWGNSEAIAHHVLLEVGHTLQQVRRAERLGIWTNTNTADSTSSPDASRIWEQTEQWADSITAKLEASRSAAVLAAAGIEVIPGCGEFYRKPALGFVVNGRSLRSRSYLLATNCRPVVPAIDGLEAAGYLTPENFLSQSKSLQRSSKIVVIGTDPAGPELAQMLLQLGLQVSLIVESAHILPDEDPEAAFLLQAQLEAEGVDIYTKTPVTQVRLIQGKKWVQAGNTAIEADEVLLATGLQPNLDSLNLEAAGVRWSAAGLEVNEKLQTSNPRIYTCTGQFGHRYTSQIARYQARIAVNNSLFFPLKKVNYRTIPQAVHSSLELARVGLTEPEALQQYGKAVLILRQHLSTVSQAQIQDETTGFCKLIVHRNGKILGGHLVAPGASNLIGTIALALQQRQKIHSLANLIHPSPTISEIISQTAAEWHRLRLQRNSRLRDLLEGWFNVRRSW